MRAMSIQKKDNPGVSPVISGVGCGLDGNLFTKAYYGRSMAPRLHSGDLLLCRKINNPTGFLWGEIYLVASASHGETLIGRPMPSRNPGNICLSFDNPDFEDMEIPTDKITGAARVVGVVSILSM